MFAAHSSALGSVLQVPQMMSLSSERLDCACGTRRSAYIAWGGSAGKRGKIEEMTEDDWHIVHRDMSATVSSAHAELIQHAAEALADHTHR